MSSSPIATALEMEEIDRNLFRSKYLWKPPGAKGVFGGQVVGLALVAASKTVPEEFLVHSLHSYFLLPGRNEIPIVYRVQTRRDGKNFCSRAVYATQKGKVIFQMICSFQTPEVGLEYHYPIPVAPEPETLINEETRLKHWASNENLPEKVKNIISSRLSQPFPIEIKLCLPWKTLTNGKPKEPKQKIWIKANGNIGDDLKFHQCVAAYASDHVFLSTAFLPHGLHSMHPDVKQWASLDHSMWFHAPFRSDEYMLFDMECPRTSGGRGLVIGRLFTKSGTLAVTCVQEGLIRVKEPSKYESKL